jgi:tRNA(Ile)-lysidine synthase
VTAAGGGRPPRAAVRAAVRTALADLEPGERALVACSGGPDSLALLAATVLVGRELGLLVGAVVVDHQLQAGSGAVAARAAEQARILGCDDVQVLPVEVAVGPGTGGPEAAARAARYEALAAAAGAGPGSIRPVSPERQRPRRRDGTPPPTGARPDLRGGAPAAVVLLGHTRDDQAETVLLGLARGSGMRSLAGMAPRDGLFRRPLLDLPRAAAAETATEDPRLEPWVDPHNADRTYTRVRVREQALPALEDALGPGVVDALARTARLARADADALDAWADREWAAAVRRDPAAAFPEEPGIPGTRVDDPSGLDGHVAARPECTMVREAAAWADQLPAAVVSRVVRRLLLAAGCPAGALTAEHVARVVALLDGPAGRAEVALPGGRRARREGGRLVVRA